MEDYQKYCNYEPQINREQVANIHISIVYCKSGNIDGETGSAFRKSLIPDLDRLKRDAYS